MATSQKFYPRQPDYIEQLNALDTSTLEAAPAAAAAIEAKDLAETASDEAAISATVAVDAATAAEAAASGAGVYDSVALGQAAYPSTYTGPQSFYQVKKGGLDADGVNILVRQTMYQRTGTSTQEALYTLLPASEFDSAVPTTLHPGYAWSVDDAAGRSAIGVRTDGAFEAPEAYVDELHVESINGEDAENLALMLSATVPEAPLGFAWSVVDQDGRAAIGVRNDGTFEATDIASETLTTVSASAITVVATDLSADTLNGVSVSDYVLSTYVAQGFATDIAHILTYGQSLSRGEKATPVISTTQPYDSLKFNGGVRPDDTGSGPRTSLVPLTETAVSGPIGETPSAGTAHAVKQLILSEDGIAHTDQSYQLLLSADGQGGRTIAELSEGTTYYTRMVTSIQAGFNLAQAAGKTYSCPVMTWTQGEADYAIETASAVYEAAMEQLRSDATASVQAITGIANELSMICYQTASHKHYGLAYPNIALAQLQASKDHENIFLATPMYHMEYYAVDHVHLTPASSKKLGFHYGLAYKRVIVDGVRWRPLMPISKIKQGAVATVRFHVPVGKLMFDTTLVVENTNKGFNIFKADGTEITISSVVITGPDTIRIVAAETIPAGAKLQYAFYGSGESGLTDGPRGNLRDQQGDSIVFDPAGLNYAAHNWCVMFEEIFTE
ncbi:sialate O-acetylesterase [uncultured Ramlibacter sp.]|uniref:sialate O-acetylesterase n=1 Tax=uncultured Ramlibacter sp. TaxID=260755 RepID=UPI002610C27A|nr:sialate O-acetylesterase [uncultured Ramlibacter sp.]